MTVITAPPDRNGLVLDQGDVLVVNNHGLASNTVINAGGRLEIFGGGASDHTTVNLLGIELVDQFGSSNNSVVNKGGREIVEGVSNGTTIVGGVERVDHGGHANDTTIGGSGRLEVLLRAVATDVTFADQGRNSVEILNPAHLKGTITNWHVGDFIDLLEFSEGFRERVGQRPDGDVRAEP